jgi:peptide/nickel transport system substrate-binding protein
LLAACSPASAPPHDATVVVLPRVPEELDPRFVADAYGLKVSRLLFASLVTIDPHTLEILPDLAETIEQPSPTEYVVTLRRGLAFADGSTLDATDVVATYRGVAHPSLGSRYAVTYRRIAEVRALSPRVVRFRLHEPHAPFLTDLELPIVRAEDAWRRMPFDDATAFVGAGPYRLRERSERRLELEANEHWYGGAPTHARLRFVVVQDDNVRALRMVAGKGDVALNAIPALLLPMLAERSELRIERVPGIGTTYLGCNTESPALRDPRVRHAIALAIDRASLVRAKLGGHARLAEGWIPPGHPLHTPLSETPFDPRLAHVLLDEAGLRADDDGVRARLVLRVGADRARVSVARAIAAMLRDVGLDVEVRPSESATFFADLNDGRFDLAFLQLPELYEPHLLSWFFASDKIPGEGGEGANRWRYRSPALDALLERGRTTSNLEARRAIYGEAERLLANDRPTIPLWHEDSIAVVREGVIFRVPRDGRLSPLAR